MLRFDLRYEKAGGRPCDRLPVRDHLRFPGAPLTRIATTVSIVKGFLSGRMFGHRFEDRLDDGIG